MAFEDRSSVFSEHDHLMSSNGKSTGAAMLVDRHQRHLPEVEDAQQSSSCCCCCINIYVNNNIQGVTNSVLLGSRVVMRDPGTRLSFRHHGQSGKHHQRIAQAAEGKKKPCLFQTWVLLLVLICYLVFLVIWAFGTKSSP